MNAAVSADLERRVVCLAPTRRDADLARSILERAGVSFLGCSDLQGVCAELDRGAGALLVPEEAVDRGLFDWTSRQPPWSDLPILVLARPGANSEAIADAMDRLGNVTVLERPMRVAALVSAARTALRARQRQYQIREYLAERAVTEAALRDKDRRKDEFLAILAHELRNPLAPIRNALHLLRRTGGNPATVNRVGAMMERQLDHVVRLVDDLMEVSRITRGKIELRRERLDLAAVLRDAVEVSRPVIEAAMHRFETALPDEPLPLDADAVRLTQVFANLLNNAAKYTDPGGTIRLEARVRGDRIAVSVRDSGTGIPAEMLPHVFDLFMQVDHATDRAQGGLGIGLTLVKSLVEMHGGSVEVSSAGPGQGSEFVVWLPRATPTLDSCGAKPEAPKVPKALPPQRILIVDDNRDAADSLAMLLEVLGAESHVVYSGPDALASLEATDASTVIMDIGMPGMDGYELARRVRRNPRLQGLTLIALTGWGQEDDYRKTREAGFDHHLVKPVDISQLEKLLGPS